MQMTLIHSRENIPNEVNKTIFLAGPTPRDYTVNNSWRTEAIEILKSLNYDGVVYIHEERNNPFPKELLEQ